MTANQPPEDDAPQTPAGTPQAPPPTAGPIGPAFGADRPQAQPESYPPSAFAAPPPLAPKKTSVRRRWLIIMAAVVVAIVVGILVRSGVFDSPAMKVGDCVTQVEDDNVKVVACGSADAQYTVLGIVEKQSQISARMGACKEFPETTSVYWQGRNNGNGTAYCLKKL